MSASTRSRPAWSTRRCTRRWAILTEPDVWGAEVPLGRPARPEEIAAAVAWLMSPEASYATGAVLRVAGGR
ncbi:hypothetical protein GCM10020256_66610 [Streptomyces thermocoprophilus]